MWVFDLAASLTGVIRVYAWFDKPEDSERICVVPHSPSMVETPRDAVRATILARAITAM